MSLLETIKSASEIAQRCQRNWDLSKIISDDIVDVLKQVVINSPSKQNEEYYSVIFCTNRDIIENIYNNTLTDAASENLDINKNSQVLANLLVIFCKENHNTGRNNDTDMHTNRQLAIGIAAGQIALSASMLGLRTGFCKCFDSTVVNSLLGVDKSVELLLGIGYPNNSKNRREHQFNSIWYPSHNKNITVSTIDDKNVILEKFPSTCNTHSICVYFDYSNVDGDMSLDSPIMNFIKKHKGTFDQTQRRIDTQVLRKNFNIDPAMLSKHHPENKLVVHSYTGDSQENLELFKSNMLAQDETILFLTRHGWLVS